MQPKSTDVQKFTLSSNETEDFREFLKYKYGEVGSSTSYQNDQVEDKEENEEEQHLRKRAKQVKRQNDSYEVLTLKKKSTTWKSFEKAVQQCCFRCDAFPSCDQARLDTEQIVLRLNGYSRDDTAQVDEALTDDYLRILSKKRTSLHSAVGNWLSNKTFPPNCSNNADYKRHLYQYLLDENRFVRRNYEEGGRFLFNDDISDCIRSTLLNRMKTTSRLHPVPSTIPRQVICLIAQMIRYRLEKALVNLGEVAANSATLSKWENGVDKYGWGSSWSAAYHDMLDEEGTLGQHTDWSGVERHVTKGVLEADKAKIKAKTPIQTWGCITSSHDQDDD